MTTTPAVTITARQASRWRCGVQFTDKPVNFPAGHWSEGQLVELRGDPQLVVVESSVAAPGNIPSTPTVEAALKTALEALRQATPGQVEAFLRAAEADPDIRERIEAEVAADRAAAEPTRKERLVAGIGALEEGNKEHWTEDGRPDVFALRKAVGLKDVSAAERDAAFEAWKIAAGKELTGG